MATLVRAANPIWYFVDLLGFSLNDTYYISFLSNVFPYVPQLVYMDNQGVNAWSDPLEFLPNGTLPQNLYFDPTLVYRLEIRNGPTQNDQLIYLIPDFVPPADNGSGSSSGSNQDNQIANPQFVFVNFGFIPTNSAIEPSMLITTAGTYNIAPGWQLILTGTGTTTLTQLINIADQNQPSDNVPPYALRINNFGWTSATLQQQFNGNGALWANEFVSMSILAQAESVLQNPIELIYAPSGSASIPIASGSPSTGSFQVIQGVVAVTPSTSSALNNVSFVDMQIILPTTGTVDISDVQVVGQVSADISLQTFPVQADETLERQKDHLFHHYANELITKPKKNILTGWIFSQNPYQFISSAAATVTPQCSYIADQTILYQNAGSQVVAGIDPSIQFRQSLLVQAAVGSTDNRFALIQYIHPLSIKPYWSYLLSSLVRARIALGTGNTTKIRIKMRLIASANLPTTIGAAEPIASWPANSDPVFSSAWTTVIAPLNDPAYILPEASDTQGSTFTIPPFPFDSFQMPDDLNASQTLGVVFYTMDQMNSTSGFVDQVLIDRISLVPNEFAVDASPTTYDETLRECQFYYEKSYGYGILPGAVSAPGKVLFPANIYIDGSGNESLYLKSFWLQFKQTKCQVPTFKFYSTDGTASDVSVGIFSNGNPQVRSGSLPNPTNITASGSWSASATTNTDSAAFICINTTTQIMEVLQAQTALGDEGFIQFHYTLDARLGV